jgi:NAD(P)H-nitrite reductase large subunit
MAADTNPPVTKGIVMHRIAASILAVAALATTPACKKGGGSCSDVVDHVEKISGFDIPADKRQAAIDKCEKEPAAKRECAMKAENLGDLMKCK